MFKVNSKLVLKEEFVNYALGTVNRLRERVGASLITKEDFLDNKYNAVYSSLWAMNEDDKLYYRPYYNALAALTENYIVVDFNKPSSPVAIGFGIDGDAKYFARFSDTERAYMSILPTMGEGVDFFNNPSRTYCSYTYGRDHLLLGEIAIGNLREYLTHLPNSCISINSITICKDGIKTVYGGGRLQKLFRRIGFEFSQIQNKESFRVIRESDKR